MGELFGIGIFVFLVVLGYSVGSARERRHLRSLSERESQLGHIVYTNVRTIPSNWKVTNAALVDGQAVIASDYFKTLMAKLRNLFGGEVRSLETLMARARREAILRMLDQAAAMGASAVWNVRLETSTIGRGTGRKKGGLATAEIYAYGTALVVDQ